MAKRKTVKIKFDKIDLVAFFTGVSDAFRRDDDRVGWNDFRGGYVYKLGVETMDGYLKDAVPGKAPGLSIGDYIDVALEEAKVIR